MKNWFLPYYRPILSVVFLLVGLTATHTATAQEDSTQQHIIITTTDGKIKADTLEIVHPAKIYTQIPGKAALYSTVFPGLGQVYNEKYWKLILVYGALGAGIYAIDFNNAQYNIYLDAFFTRVDTDPDNDQFVGVYDERQLIELQNIYRKYRDLSIMLTGLAYGLQILDAYVDAHLLNFDVSDDLTLNWEPAIIQSSFSSPAAFGLGLKLSFK